MLKRQVEEATGREDKDPGMRFYIYHSAFLKNLILRITYEHDRVRDLIPPGNNLLLSVFFFFFLPFRSRSGTGGTLFLFLIAL